VILKDERRVDREDAPAVVLVTSTWRVLGYGNFPSGILL
jgi:hypothetical protein